MARVTSKLQVTVPKVIADRYEIRPGDEIEWIPAGENIRVTKVGANPSREGGDMNAHRLRRFDEATKRQAQRQRSGAHAPASDTARGWKREDIYNRGRSR